MNDAAGVKALHLHVECSFAAVRHGALKLRSFLKEQRLAEPEIWACELAFVEGCNNAVQHTPQRLHRNGIDIELTLVPSHLELRINDHTSGCDFPAQPGLPPAENETGRGIFLMSSLMDDVTYIRRDSSNCLVLKKALTGI